MEDEGGRKVVLRVRSPKWKKKCCIFSGGNVRYTYSHHFGPASSKSKEILGVFLEDFIHSRNLDKDANLQGLHTKGSFVFLKNKTLICFRIVGHVLFRTSKVRYLK